MTLRALGRGVVLAGSIASTALTVHTAYNLTRLRTPSADPPRVDEPISVLVPARDEAHRIGPTLRALLAQERCTDIEFLILDDGSTDGTAEVVTLIAADDPRVRIVTGSPRPDHWLGKTWACAQLAALARGRVLVFIDADVVLAPHAVASAVSLLRTIDLDLVSPYPRQVAVSASERLVQPLLQWSWLTTLPLGLAESSPRESLAAANGQFLIIDADAYARCGGHAEVRAEVLDDVSLLRAVKRAGGRGTVVDGTSIAACRMYNSWDEVQEGYTKSLWSAFGSPAGAVATTAVLAGIYIVPAVAALRGSRIGLVGYTSAVAGRALVARRVEGRVIPDAFAHPASIAALGWLTAQSWRRKRAGTLQWKGRSI